MHGWHKGGGEEREEDIKERIDEEDEMRLRHREQSLTSEPFSCCVS